MKITSTLFVAAAVIALGAGAAAAQNRGADMLAQADANSDGAISVQEMQAARATGFTRLDRNGDGQLTGQEIRRQAARADRNSDGVITRSEFVDGPFPIFERFDANRDNLLDQQELATARAAMEGRRNGGAG